MISVFISPIGVSAEKPDMQFFCFLYQWLGMVDVCGGVDPKQKKLVEDYIKFKVGDFEKVKDELNHCRNKTGVGFAFRSLCRHSLIHENYIPKLKKFISLLEESYGKIEKGNPPIDSKSVLATLGSYYWRLGYADVCGDVSSTEEMRLEKIATSTIIFGEMNGMTREGLFLYSKECRKRGRDEAKENKCSKAIERAIKELKEDIENQ